MLDQTDSARTELAERLRLALRAHPAFEVRQIGRREVRVARPYDHEQERTPYRFSLLLEEKRRYAEIVEHWSSDGGTPLRRDRDSEQPVRDLIAAELAEAGWTPGRSLVGWAIDVVKWVAWAASLTMIVVLICVFLAR